jgi:plasmid stabilization system protein ParE
MSAKRVQYHEGATADVKNAVAWYQKRSSKAALDFIEELHRAADTIREAPDRWPTQGQHQTVPALAISLSIIYSERVRSPLLYLTASRSLDHP